MCVCVGRAATDAGRLFALFLSLSPSFNNQHPQELRGTEARIWGGFSRHTYSTRASMWGPSGAFNTGPPASPDPASFLSAPLRREIISACEQLGPDHIPSRSQYIKLMSFLPNWCVFCCRRSLFWDQAQTYVPQQLARYKPNMLKLCTNGAIMVWKLH